MEIKRIDKQLWVSMIHSGANHLRQHRETINKLNVFPVPDGDTGTNMNLSMASGVKEMTVVSEQPLALIVSNFVNGLLMGARGNSGVILSQLFRGFGSCVESKETIDAKTFAAALNEGVRVAYAAVTKPVEGTILTVAKDAAFVAQRMADDNAEIIPLVEEVVTEARASLERTPDLLPVLREVGVVDSGGKGLVVIYEGFLAALKGEAIENTSTEMDFDVQMKQEHEQSVQSFISLDDIDYGYCTEFFVEFEKEKLEKNLFQEEQFRETLSEYGDSLLVAASAEAVKVHIHTEEPGKVMTFAQQFGQLIKIDIENMRKQYQDILNQDETSTFESGLPYAIVTVAQGDGLGEMFKSLGATIVIDGGQTMNPSTEDFLKMIEKINAEHTFLLPNNKNIMLAAEQATQISDKQVTVIPSVTIPQGMKALFEFDEGLSMEENKDAMTEALSEVKTGSITYATRDTTINELEIKKGHFIGMNDETIKVAETSKLAAVQSLMLEMVDENDEIMTVFSGEGVQEQEISELENYIKSQFEDVEVEFHYGNQPIYSFIIMIE